MNLSMKNVPEDVVERLRTRARGHHRSLQGELRAVLEEVLATKRLTVEEAYQQVTSLGVQTTCDSAEILRESRDARAGR
jgi:plasmid stability protein